MSGNEQWTEVQIEKKIIERVDSWINETGKASSRDDAIHQLLEMGLSVASGKNIQLTDGDKLNFMMLRDIVKHLKIKDAETNSELVSEVIYGGHYWAPTWEMQGLFHRHQDQPEDVKFVVDTLDMWSFIEEAIEKFSPQDIELVKAANHGHLPTFTGFDGNEEGSLLSIARFLVEKMGRFARFKGRGFNSHTNTAERNRRMFRAFEPMRAELSFRKQLSAEQIIELLKTR